MNTQQIARSAYARPDAPARDTRSVEYDLFARITRKLAGAWSNRGSDHPGLINALYENGRLWRTLASDVAEPTNGLPATLRARLFYLYEFTAQHSQKVVQGDASAEVLIDINTAIMRGLRGDGGMA